MKLKNIKFMSHRRLLWLISLTVMTIGIVFNILNGTMLDIKFTGGAIFRYTFSDFVSGSDVDTQECANAISDSLGKMVRVSINTRVNSDDSEEKTLVVSLAENSAVGHTADSSIRRAISRLYPSIELTLRESNSIDPSEGKVFLTECIIAFTLAFALMLVYISLRFRKTGGILTAVCGLCAMLHDCLVVYFAFIIFKFPLDDTFIAAVLVTMGYSLNSTIVVFDRIRENKRLLGAKIPVAKLADISLNETITRNMSTTLCMFTAVAITAIVSLIYGLDAISSFTAPLLFGVVSGFYSSICISVSLFVSLSEFKEGRAMKKHKT